MKKYRKILIEPFKEYKCNYCKETYTLPIFGESELKEFGLINNKICCEPCIEKNDLVDEETIKSEKFGKLIKSKTTKYIKEVNENFKQIELNNDHWSNDYLYYYRKVDECKTELIRLLALKEAKSEIINKNNSDVNQKEIEFIEKLNLRIEEYKEFLKLFIKSDFKDSEDIFLGYKPSTQIN